MTTHSSIDPPSRVAEAIEDPSRYLLGQFEPTVNRLLAKYLDVGTYYLDIHISATYTAVLAIPPAGNDSIWVSMISSLLAKQASCKLGAQTRAKRELKTSSVDYFLPPTPTISLYSMIPYDIALLRYSIACLLTYST